MHVTQNFLIYICENSVFLLSIITLHACAKQERVMHVCVCVCLCVCVCVCVFVYLWLGNFDKQYILIPLYMLHVPARLSLQHCYHIEAAPLVLLTHLSMQMWDIFSLYVQLAELQIMLYTKFTVEINSAHTYNTGV